MCRSCYSSESQLTYVLDWKRLLLADAPRQTINALILYSVFLAVNADPKKDPRPWYNPVKYVDNELGLSTNILSVTTFFTVAVCAGSILLMLGAAICYIPLLFHIRGNLKASISFTFEIALTSSPLSSITRSTAAIRLTSESAR